MGRLGSAAAWVPLAFCAPLAAPAQEPPPATEAPTVVRTIATPDNRVTIPIHIDGKGPWPFIIDTGSQRTVISRDLAEQLALPTRRQVIIISMTGRSQARTVGVSRIGYGGVTVDDIEAPVLEAAHLGASGLLGLDSLHAKRLLLNFRTGRMEVTNSRRAWRDPNAIIVEARRRKGQLILLDSDVNGMKVNIVLDTGTDLSVGNIALMNKLVAKKRAPALNTVSVMSVTGETLVGQMGRIDRIRMRTITLSNMPVMFADAQPFEELGLRDKPALLLGMHALRMFHRVAIDFGRGNVDFLMPDGSARPPDMLAHKDSVAG